MQNDGKGMDSPYAFYDTLPLIGEVFICTIIAEKNRVLINEERKETGLKFLFSLFYMFNSYPV
jgi:hypothetical protein